MQQPTCLRLGLVLAVLWSSSACMDPNVRDRALEACTEPARPLKVRVVDWEQAPAPHATVVAYHVDSGALLTATADAQGESTAVGEELGPGMTTLHAFSGSKISRSESVSWTCDDCHCVPEPAVLELVLQH